MWSVTSRRGRRDHHVLCPLVIVVWLLLLLLLVTMVLLHLLLLIVAAVLLVTSVVSILIRLLLTNRRLLRSVASVTILGQQDTTDALVGRLQLSQVGRRNLDWVACHRKNHNVFPRMDLILVLHHLWSLPVILNTSPLQGELFDLD